MTRRLGCIGAVAVSCALGAVPVAAQDAIRLRSRTFVPAPNIGVAEALAERAIEPLERARTASPSRRHLLIQFDRTPDRSALERIRAAGAIPLRYVPDNALAVSVPADFDPTRIAGARWTGHLQPVDRLSQATRADLDRPAPLHPLTLVEFHPDVTAAEIDAHLAAAGASRLNVTGLASYTALIPTQASTIVELALLDAVAWIYPGRLELEASRPAALCAGALRTEGIVANYATTGDGWDGPGLGAATLGYFVSRASPDLSAAMQLAELTRAMEEWSRYVQVSWTPQSSGTRQRTVNISWLPLDHQDGFPFTSEILAHTFYPAPVVSEPLAGDVHFNDALLWGAGNPERWDVFSVALHELGHSLGLQHADDPDSVMYPILRRFETGLAAIDIQTIRGLYASTTTGALPSGWMASRIGPAAGMVAVSGGRFTVTAGGADIWGTSDEFGFVASALHGDGDIVARVDSLTGTNRWSKAGLMIRSSANARAAHGFALVSLDRGVAFQRRATYGGASEHTDGGPGTAPRWLWLSRRGARVEAYSADDGSDWHLIGHARIALELPALAGLAVTNHATTGTATAVFSHVSITPQPAPVWLSTDIGAVGRAGRWTRSGDRLRVTAAGPDIWGNEDAFRFVWRTVAGDVDVVVRLTSLSRTRSWTKAGVMIRGGLERGAAHGAMLGSAAKGFAFQRRPRAGGLSEHTAGGAGAAPAWLKLSRRGNVVTAYRSADGRQWTRVGSDTIGLGSLAFIGVAVSSHSAEATCDAVFDGLTIEQVPP